MQTANQATRGARALFRLCVTSGSLDEDRVRQVVQRLIASGRPGGLGILSRFHRLVRLDSARHRVSVESATPLARAERAGLEAALARMYGAEVTASFTEDPSLIAGVRIAEGSDVYDASIKGRLAALESRF